MLKIKSAFLFAVILCSKFLFAQKSDVQKTDSTGFYKLSDVVITATRTPSSTLELANSISTIDSTEIVNKNAQSTFDVLKNEYGLSFSQQGNKAGVATVFMRGGNSYHTLVLVDGVEVNLPSDPSNFYNFFALPVDNISRIEVLRGPQSTLYGSDALSGVINIITNKGTGKPSLNFSAEGGSYNTYKGVLSSIADFGKLNYSFALSRIKSDGFSSASETYGNTEKDGYQIDNISSLAGYNFSENFNADLTVRFNKSKTNLDQSDGPPQFWDDPTYVFNQEEFYIRGQGKLKLMDNKWNQNFGFAFFRNIRKYSFDSSTASIYSSWSNYDGRRYKADWQNDIQINKNNLITAGAEFEIEEILSEYYLTTSINLPVYASVIPKTDVNNLGIFLQDQFKATENFFGTIGIRLDRNSQFGSAITYRIAPAYMIWETATKLKATFGTGFKAPSLFYLFDPAYGNPDLNPERSLGWDAGIEQFFWSEGLSIGANYFFNKYDNMFDFDPVSFRTININKAETNGIEVFTKVNPTYKLLIKANYTYTNAKDKSENSPNYNKKLVRRPDHKAGLYISYSFSEKINANTEFIYVGKREEIDYFNYPSRIIMPDYFLINVAAHYNIFSFLRLNFRIENLLNRHYEEIYGFGAPALSVYGGISLRVE